MESDMRLKFVRPLNDVRMIDADDFRCTIVPFDEDAYLRDFIDEPKGPEFRFVFDNEPAHIAGWPIDVLIVEIEGKGRFVCPASCDLYVLNETGKTIERFRGMSRSATET